VAARPSAPVGQPAAADFGRGLDERLWRWVMLSPALLLLLALSVLPLINLFATSFFTVSWSGGHSAFTAAGLGNYHALAGDTLFRAGVLNTILFALFAVGGQMLCGFALALLCTGVTWGRLLYRTIFILPILVPGIVVGAIWKLLLNFDFGLVNQLIALPGFDLARLGEHRACLGDLCRHLALDAVLLPLVPRRPPVPASGRL
jgi:multiple sugar transport system permease protein